MFPEGVRGRIHVGFGRSKINVARSAEWTQERGTSAGVGPQTVSAGFLADFCRRKHQFPGGWAQPIFVRKYDRDPDVPVGGEPGWSRNLALRIARLRNKSVLFSEAI